MGERRERQRDEGELVREKKNKDTWLEILVWEQTEAPSFYTELCTAEMGLSV